MIKTSNTQRQSVTSQAGNSEAESCDFPGYTSTGRYYNPQAEELQIRRLDELGSLPPDWDGTGALPPTPEVIRNAKVFRRRLATGGDMAINPTCDGGVQFEWSCGSRTLEIEFSPEEPVSYICWDGNPETAREGELVLPVNCDQGAIRDFENTFLDLLNWVRGS